MIGLRPRLSPSIYKSRPPNWPRPSGLASRSSLALAPLFCPVAQSEPGRLWPAGHLLPLRPLESRPSARRYYLIEKTWSRKRRRLDENWTSSFLLYLARIRQFHFINGDYDPTRRSFPIRNVYLLICFPMCAPIRLS